MLDCALGFDTSPFMIVPNDFWQNPDLFKKKKLVLLKKLTNVEHFYINGLPHFIAGQCELDKETIKCN